MVKIKPENTNREYIFMPGEISDLPSVYRLIDERIHWMDDVGIEQWNVTDYWECYPEAYYEKAVRDHHLYVLKRKEDGRVVAVAVLYEEDSRWKKDGATAYYVHHLATELGERGAGKVLLQHSMALAKKNRKDYLRLDCAIDNEKLNDYYDRQNFTYAGTCVDGKYVGNLREIKTKESGSQDPGPLSRFP